jgi:hypothetical protein
MDAAVKKAVSQSREAKPSRANIVIEKIQAQAKAYRSNIQMSWQDHLLAQAYDYITGGLGYTPTPREALALDKEIREDMRKLPDLSIIEDRVRREEEFARREAEDRAREESEEVAGEATRAEDEIQETQETNEAQQEV